MDAARLLRSARLQAGLTLRQLAAAAHTSHSTLAAYETGAKCPTVETLNRIVEAAGFRVETSLALRAESFDHAARGRELADVLELAEAFAMATGSAPNR
ncbi:MAG: helix-turn-helix transcriptional regulator [Acidimicrobiales bacterium]